MSLICMCLASTLACAWPHSVRTCNAVDIVQVTHVKADDVRIVPGRRIHELCDGKRLSAESGGSPTGMGAYDRPRGYCTSCRGHHCQDVALDSAGLQVKTNLNMLLLSCGSVSRL
jgi:hypothetical protein